MRVFFLLIGYFILFIVYICGLFIQSMNNVNNKPIFFGIRTPIGYEKNEKLIRWNKEYKRNYSISNLIFIAIYTLIFFNVTEEAGILVMLLGGFLDIAVLLVNYLVIHNKVKELKKDEKWQLESKNIVVVDTKYRAKDKQNGKSAVSSWWFLIPLLMMTGNIIFILLEYLFKANKLTIDFSVVLVLLVQASVNLLFFLLYRWTKRAKQELNGGKVDEINYRGRKRRYYFSLAYLLLTIPMNILFIMISLAVSSVIDPSILSNIWLVSILAIIAPLVIIVVLLLATRANSEFEDIPKTEDGKLIINRDDDKYYKLGMIYYNRNDPAFTVEKRVGEGITFNFAKPAAKVLTVAFIGLMVFTIIIIAAIPGSTKSRKVDVTQDKISISGTWGLEINKNEISKVDIENKMPRVILKTNGADISNKLFGRHRLEGYNKSILFIEDDTKPFVAIYLKDGRLVLINYEDKNKTDDLYNRIISSMKIG